MQVEIKWPVQITEVSRPPTISPQTTGVMLCDGFGGVGLPDFVIPGGSPKTAADGLDRIHMIRYLPTSVLRTQYSALCTSRYILYRILNTYL